MIANNASMRAREPCRPPSCWPIVPNAPWISPTCAESSTYRSRGAAPLLTSLLDGALGVVPRLGSLVICSTFSCRSQPSSACVPCTASPLLWQQELEHVVKRDHSDRFLVAVDDRDPEQIEVGHQPRDLGKLGLRRDRRHGGLDQARDERVLLSANQLGRQDAADQVPVGVDHPQRQKLARGQLTLAH